jgi:small-conductance mechanosensitive channel
MDKNLLELIVVGILFLVSSRIAYLRARRRPQKDRGETDWPRAWAIREHVLTLVSAITMLIFLLLYLWLAYREVFG